MSSKPPQPEPPRWPRLILRRTDQAAAAAALAVSLAIIGGWSVAERRLSGRLIDIDRTEPIAVEFKIDVNHADWPELALMPNIGEQLARRIVADRQERGAFRDLADLRRVRGIGPKTLESMRPFLLPIPGLETTAESDFRVQKQPARVN
jgi:competence protein ComEA